MICINGNKISNTVCICSQGYTDGPQDPSNPNILVRCALQISPTTNSSGSSASVVSGNYNLSYLPYNSSLINTSSSNLDSSAITNQVFP